MIFSIFKISAAIIVVAAVVNVVSSRSILENLLDEYLDPVENFEEFKQLPKSNGYSRLIAKRNEETSKKSPDKSDYWNSGGIGSSDTKTKDKIPVADKSAQAVETTKNPWDVGVGQTSSSGIWKVKSDRGSGKIAVNKKAHILVDDSKKSTMTTTPKTSNDKTEELTSSNDQFRSFSIKKKLGSFVQKWSSWKTYEEDDSMYGDQYSDGFINEQIPVKK